MFAIIAMQVSAALSMFACLCMIIVILRLKLTKLLFMKLVFYVAICDFGGAMAMVIGGVRTGSAACYYQGLVNNYCVLASVLWTMVIGYEVHQVIWYNRAVKNLNYFTVINWTLPLILSFIPLSTATYGNDDGTPHWCFFNGRHGYPEWIEGFWYIVAFYLWIYIAVGYLSYVTLLSAYKLYYLQRGMITNANVVLQKLIVYPLIVVGCWIVSSIIDVHDVFEHRISVDEHNPASVFFLYMLPNLQGFLSGMVFFLSNRQVVTEFLKDMQESQWFTKERSSSTGMFFVDSSFVEFLDETDHSSLFSHSLPSIPYFNRTITNSSFVHNASITSTTPSPLIPPALATSGNSNLIRRPVNRYYDHTYPGEINTRTADLLSNAHMQDSSSPSKGTNNTTPTTTTTINNKNNEKMLGKASNNNTGMSTTTTNNHTKVGDKSKLSSKRDSDIELNRPSSFVHQIRPTVEYGRWDDHSDSFETLGDTSSNDTRSGRTSETPSHDSQRNIHPRSGQSVVVRPSIANPIRNTISEGMNNDGQHHNI